MTPLRQRMLDALVLRGMAARTQESYLEAVSRLARHYGCSPELLSADESSSTCCTSCASAIWREPASTSTAARSAFSMAPCSGWTARRSRFRWPRSCNACRRSCRAPRWRPCCRARTTRVRMRC